MQKSGIPAGGPMHSRQHLDGLHACQPSCMGIPLRIWWIWGTPVTCSQRYDSASCLRYPDCPPVCCGFGNHIVLKEERLLSAKKLG